VLGLRICQSPRGGLGLSIAKLLVEAQGGRQTRFWIDLPLAAKGGASDKPAKRRGRLEKPA